MGLASAEDVSDEIGERQQTSHRGVQVRAVEDHAEAAHAVDQLIQRPYF